MKIEIKNDVFNIAKRLKQYNKNYYILYNQLTKKFEVHNSQFKNSLCLVLPFKQLNIEAIKYVLKSEHVEDVINEIEINNKKLDYKNIEKQRDQTTYKFNEIYKYAVSHGKEFDGNAFNDTWI